MLWVTRSCYLLISRFLFLLKSGPWPHEMIVDKHTVREIQYALRNSLSGQEWAPSEQETDALCVISSAKSVVSECGVVCRRWYVLVKRLTLDREVKVRATSAKSSSDVQCRISAPIFVTDDIPWNSKASLPCYKKFVCSWTAPVAFRRILLCHQQASFTSEWL